MSLKRLMCRIGMHKFIRMPVKCITLSNHRNIIVCESVCTICGVKDDLL